MHIVILKLYGNIILRLLDLIVIGLIDLKMGNDRITTMVQIIISSRPLN